MNEARRPPPPFDLSIVTGFLGAGKTTLLNALLRDPDLADTLVIINEFGEVGLDHFLIEKVDGDMLVMTSGCLCCSIRGDLVATLEDALRNRDNGRIAFRRVVIETTGLADPAPVLHTVMTHPYLRLRFALHAVVGVVDALVGETTLDTHREAVKQAALANRLVLTKTDLLPDAEGAAPLKQRLRKLNPMAPQLDAATGEARAAVLFAGLPYEPSARSMDAAAWLAAEAVEVQLHRGHQHGHAAGAPPDINRHDATIRSFCLREPRPVSSQAVSLFLELLRSAHGQSLLRLKGLIALEDDPERPLVVHGVQHVMHLPQRFDRWPDADRQTRLVMILRDLDPAFVRGLWRSAVGDPQVDSADLATRAANPLALAKGGLFA